MSKSESLLHWEKKFRDGTVDDEHRDFIADTLAAAREDITEEQKAGEDFCQACEDGTCNEYEEED